VSDKGHLGNNNLLRPTITVGEGIFILGFGLFHLFLPFVAPPNFLATVIPVYSLFWGLNLADLVIPGCIVVASLSVAFIYTKHRVPMAALMFMYLSGAFFHALFLVGFLPPLLIVSQSSYLAFGIFIDIFIVALSYDYYRRSRYIRHSRS
jgi:hypothetical protein